MNTDTIRRKTISPARDGAGAAPAPPGAGARQSRPRHSDPPRTLGMAKLNELDRIRASQDAGWLHSVATDADRPMSIRDAACRRFRALTLAAKKRKESNKEGRKA